MIRKMPIKITVGYHFMPSCRQKLKSEVQRVSENVGKQEPSYVAGENVISTTILQSNLAISVKVEHVQAL